MLLSHTQFIENRVYDDDDEEETTSKKTGANNNGDIKSDNLSKDPEAAFIHNVTTALKTSFDFIHDSFHQVEVSLQRYYVKTAEKVTNISKRIYRIIVMRHYIKI